MIAGRITLGRHLFRVTANAAAVGALAADATFGVDGREGAIVRRQFMQAVIDPRDQVRWHCAAAHASDADLNAAAAAAIGMILTFAARSPDPRNRQWAQEFRAAVEAFKAGDQGAFAEQAFRNQLRRAGQGG